MKKVLLLVAAIIVVWLATAWATTADSGIPEGVEVFMVGDHTCVLYDTGLECFCPCGGCYVQTEVAPTPTGRPGQTATVIPTDPVGTPTPQDTPPPPEKEKCNRGLGNDSEGCDPGNSSGQGQGQGRDAGEDKNEHKKDK